jgi:hypothetical protein
VSGISSGPSAGPGGDDGPTQDDLSEVGQGKARPPFPVPLIVIGGAIAAVGLAAVLWVLLFGGFGGGGGGGGASAEPSAGPSASADASEEPATSPSVAASPSSAPVSPSPSPAPVELPPPLALLVETGAISETEAGAIVFDTDPEGDHVHVDPARSPDLTDPAIDIETYEVLDLELTTDAATALTNVAGCEDFTAAVVVLCNQAGPLVAGPVYVAMVGYAGPIPLPPYPGQNLWSFDAVFSDGDPTTGAQVSGNNFNAGAEINYEVIFFRNQQGTDRGYTLLSDWRKPPRADTGQIQGNVATLGRVFAFPADGWLLFVLPSTDAPDVSDYLTGAFMQDRVAQLIGIDSTLAEMLPSG